MERYGIVALPGKTVEPLCGDGKEKGVDASAGELGVGGDVPGGGDEAGVDGLPVSEHGGVAGGHGGCTGCTGCTGWSDGE